MGIDLRKFEQEYASKDPQLVDLTKKTGVCLQKHNLAGNVAKVAVCLDISGSMSRLYRSGAVSELVKKLIPLGLSFDDDGEIDVFDFGETGTQQESINLGNYVQRMDELKSSNLQGRTNYAKAIRLVESFYSNQDDAHNVPVFVVFITDGDATDKDEAERAMKCISKLPIFFQFVAIGANYDPRESAPEKKGFMSRLFGSSSNANNVQSKFSFLTRLDNMSGRAVDNAGFFAVEAPDSKSPDELYDLLMSEYPDFLKAARSANILR